MPASHICCSHCRKWKQSKSFRGRGKFAGKTLKTCSSCRLRGREAKWRCFAKQRKILHQWFAALLNAVLALENLTESGWPREEVLYLIRVLSVLLVLSSGCEKAGCHRNWHHDLEADHIDPSTKDPRLRGFLLTKPF